MSDIINASPQPSGNLLLGWQNQATTGTIVASDAVAGLGPDQMQNDQGAPSMAWQTNAGTTLATLTLVRPVDTVWHALALCRTNLTPYAVVGWQVLRAGLVVASGTADAVVPNYGQAVAVIGGVAGDTLIINVDDPNNPDQFINVPLLYAGPVWQPERNFGYGSSILPDNSTTENTGRSGAEFPRTDWVRDGFDLVLGAVTPAEVPVVRDLDRFGRMGGNVLLIPQPLSSQRAIETVFGRLKPAGGIGYANNSRRTRTYRATISERL